MHFRCERIYAKCIDALFCFMYLCELYSYPSHSNEFGSSSGYLITEIGVIYLPETSCF